MKAIENVRKKYEKAKKRSDMVKKMVGDERADIDTKQLDFGRFKVLVTPTAEYELTLMEATITSLQEKVAIFEETKGMFPFITDESMRIGMVLTNGVPTGFILYTQD